MEFFRRLRYLLNRRRLDEELASDLEFHREMAARHGGMPLGNSLHLREEASDAWGWTWLDRCSQDLRYAARMLRRSPGFCLAAVLILAIGIGVNVAAFGFFNLMVLRPLPVREPATLMRFQRLAPKAFASVLPYPEMAFFRERATTLSALIAWTPSTLTMEREERPIRAHFVTANLFSELGATSRLGRLLDPSRDEANGADAVVVLSYGFWERYFGADASVTGRMIRLNGKPATVVGVVAREFSGLSLDNPDMWVPVTQHPYFVTGSKLLAEYAVTGAGVTVWGRLRPGLTPTVAQDELRALAAALRPEHPEDIWENETLPATPGAYAASTINTSHHGTGTKGPNMMVPAAALIGALTMLILAVACGNLGSLLLARGLARDREIAIRVAVGAGRGRLVRQLFTESILLGLLGAAAGLGLGYVVLRNLMASTSVPVWLDPSPDWRVMLFAVGMGFAAAILFGLTPAFQAAQQRSRATFVRQTLIGAQVAASCVLLIVAGLLVRALNHASGDPGFAYQQIVSIDPELGNNNYSPTAASAYLDTLTSRVREVPGVESISISSTPPFGNKTITMGIELGGRMVSIHTNSVDPGYFRTMKIPLLRGRDVARGDFHTVVVSQSLAAAWPEGDPLGKPIQLGDTKYTIVGIAGNARVNEHEDGTQAYFPAGLADMPWMVVMVKTAGPSEAVTAALASITRSLDPKLRPQVRTMAGSLEQKLESTKYSAMSVSVLAVVALLLACLGIVGLVAFAVSQRTKEIGIRMALGARPADIIAVIMRQFSRPIVIGLLVGVLGAAGLSQVLRQVLFGIGRVDVVAYLGAIGLFAFTAAVASLLPARRALRVDPIRALRND